MVIPRYIQYILKRDRNKDISNYCRFEGSIITVLVSIVATLTISNMSYFRLYLAILLIINFLFATYYLFKHLKSQGAI